MTRSETCAQNGRHDFDVREAAQRKLIAKGVMYRVMLQQYRLTGSAEQKKRLAEVQQELEAYAEELEEENDLTVERNMIEGDTIETHKFTIVGKIKQTSFRSTPSLASFG